MLDQTFLNDSQKNLYSNLIKILNHIFTYHLVREKFFNQSVLKEVERLERIKKAHESGMSYDMTPDDHESQINENSVQ